MLKLIFKDENRRARVLNANTNAVDLEYNFIYIEEPVITALKAAKKLDKIKEISIRGGISNPIKYKIAVIEELVMSVVYSENNEIGLNAWEITTEEIPPGNAINIYSLMGEVEIMENNDIICNRYNT
jgi:hypothetical protein